MGRRPEQGLQERRRFGKAVGFDAALLQEASPLQLFGGVRRSMRSVLQGGSIGSGVPWRLKVAAIACAKR
jgi:hypothetical protein